MMHADALPTTTAPQPEKKIVDRRPRSTPHSLTEPDAASYIGMSTAWLRQDRCRAADDRRGPAFIRVDRAIRYRLTDLDAFLNAHRVEARRSR